MQRVTVKDYLKSFPEADLAGVKELRMTSSGIGVKILESGDAQIDSPDDICLDELEELELLGAISPTEDVISTVDPIAKEHVYQEDYYYEESSAERWKSRLRNMLLLIAICTGALLCCIGVAFYSKLL